VARCHSLTSTAPPSLLDVGVRSASRPRVSDLTTLGRHRSLQTDRNQPQVRRGQKPTQSLIMLSGIAPWGWLHVACGCGVWGHRHNDHRLGWRKHVGLVWWDYRVRWNVFV